MSDKRNYSKADVAHAKRQAAKANLPMTKRTKAKRIEAWAVVVDGRIIDVSADESAIGAGAGARTAHLVEADPLARLKEDVVRCAKAWAADDTEDRAWTTNELLAAVERLERKR